MRAPEINSWELSLSMTRKQYITMRNENRLDLNLIYQHFSKEGGKLQPQEFQLALQMIPQAPGNISKTLDHKFEVSILEDKNGNFLKAI